MIARMILSGLALTMMFHTVVLPAQAAPAPVVATTAEALNLDALAKQGKDLLDKAKAAPTGSYAITLSTYKNSYTRLTALVKSSGAEQHGKYADFIIVVAGEGIELTGGTFVNRKDGKDGDATGTALEGATTYTLHKGDVIHVPAGVPHQSIEGPGQSIVTYVVKVDESATPLPPTPMAITK